MAKISITEASLRDFQLPEGVERVRLWDAKLQGFGVVIGRRGAVFVVRARVGGKRRDVVIGRYGEPGAPGLGEDRSLPWTVERARKAALQPLGAMSAGVDPVKKRKAATALSTTLRTGLATHLENMRTDRRSEASIATMEKEVERYLGDWLDRPLAEITGAELAERYKRIKTQAKARANSNPSNPKGAPVARRVIAHYSAIWSSTNTLLEGKLGNWNPAKSVKRDRLEPKGEVLKDPAEWFARVQTMTNPVGRDGLLLALHTGLRSEDVRTIRWEHFDPKARTLRLPDPKGGASRAFTIPVSKSVVEILERRRAENEERFGFVGGDGGWAFPTVVGDAVAAITDLRQQVHDGKTHARFPAEDVHTLRRSYLSIAHDAGISTLDQHVLSNHKYGSRDVHEGYVRQSAEHLRNCVDLIERAIVARLSGKPIKRAGRAKLSLVR